MWGEGILVFSGSQLIRAPDLGATCHHLSDVTWHDTILAPSTVANDGQRWQTTVNHHRTTVNHRRTTVNHCRTTVNHRRTTVNHHPNSGLAGSAAGSRWVNGRVSSRTACHYISSLTFISPFAKGPVWGCDRLVSRAKVIENQVPVAPEVRAAIVTSPVGVLELDTYSSLEADPSESLPPPVSVAPMVSPFLCLDDSESDTKILESHVSPIPHDTMLTRWRSRVASRSSSPTTSIPEIPTAPILPAPSAIFAPSSEFPLTPVVAPPGISLIVRNLVRPLPSHRLTLRYTSHHLDRFTFGSSSDHSSLDHSSSGHSISGHSLPEHASPDTTNADSSTPPRFVHPPLARTLQCIEAYLCWRSAPLSTMYPPTTSESSAEDSFSGSSVGPSRKRCRSPAATVTSSIHATRALVPSRVDLLPPHYRFKDSISPEDSVEEDIDTDVLEDIEADATAVEVAVDRDVVTRVDAGIHMEVDVGVDVEEEVEDDVTPPKWAAAEYWVRGVLLHGSTTQDIYSTTKKSFETDTL
nr:hypothetical protein [Tanacetum cinerariifolium]